MLKDLISSAYLVWDVVEAALVQMCCVIHSGHTLLTGTVCYDYVCITMITEELLMRVASSSWPTSCRQMRRLGRGSMMENRVLTTPQRRSKLRLFFILLHSDISVDCIPYKCRLRLILLHSEVSVVCTPT